MMYYPKGIPFTDYSLPTKIYDISTKKIIGEYKSQSEAAKAAGISKRRVSQCVRNKERCRRNNFNKLITFR